MCHLLKYNSQEYTLKARKNLELEQVNSWLYTVIEVK